MAKPIAPTPVSKGQAAIDFIQELSQNKKASEEEILYYTEKYPKNKISLLAISYIYFIEKSFYLI